MVNKLEPKDEVVAFSEIFHNAYAFHKQATEWSNKGEYFYAAHFASKAIAFVSLLETKYYSKEELLELNGEIPTIKASIKERLDRLEKLIF